MKKNKWGLLIFSVVTLLGLSALASVDADTKKAATELGANEVTEITFDENSYVLTARAQRDLDEIVLAAKKNGDISDVKVVAWSDQEYPPKHVTVADSQKNLAASRADAVENYLEKNLDVTHISKVNMAERPNKLEKLFKTEDRQTKKTFEATGAAPTDNRHTGFLDLKGKASHVVVMISYR